MRRRGWRFVSGVVQVWRRLFFLAITGYGLGVLFVGFDIGQLTFGVPFDFERVVDTHFVAVVVQIFDKMYVKFSRPK